MLGADAGEVGERGGDFGGGAAVGADAVDDVLREGADAAVAVAVGVGGTTCVEDPGVEALGEDLGAGGRGSRDRGVVGRQCLRG